MTVQSRYPNDRIVICAGVTSAPIDTAVLCPHCGAKGRHIYQLVGESGQTYGAMAGCAADWPKADKRLYRDSVDLVGKEREARESGRRLASWDSRRLAAMAAFALGEINLTALYTVMDTERMRKANWIRSRRAA
jgi:hypothetical protein